MRARPAGLLGRLRLRHKLQLILIVAALVPVITASSFAINLVLQGLKTGAISQTERTLRVALNLVLSHVKEVFERTVRLSEAPGLSEALRHKPGTLADLVAQHDDELLPCLVEIAGPDGKIVARHAVGRRTLGGLEEVDNAEPVRSALAYERRVTIAQPDGAAATRELIVRASAPIVDEGFQLRGAVVVSVPLDAEFADRLKAQLSADVLLYRNDTPSASSFVAPDGRREVGFAAPALVAKRVLAGANQTVEAPAYGRMFSVGLAPLQDLDGKRLGMLAVAVDEDALVAARNQAWHSLFLAAAAAVALALGLAALLSRRLTRPLSHLHAGAVAVARGDLDHRFVQETGDEIGDLAVAFAQMTRAVKENRDRLAARVREIVTMHDIGRAVSSVLALDQVLDKTVTEIAHVLAAQRCAILLARENGTLELAGKTSAAALASDNPRMTNPDIQALRAPILIELAEALAWRGGPVRIEDIGAEVELRDAAMRAGVVGSVLAVPLEQKDHVLGMLLVTREGQPFSEADLRLVATFAHQASTAISNARLYDEVQKASSELEAKVEERTAALVVANADLNRALDDLRAAQAALVHSERMAGLGQLVAGVAHEVNSPAAAIQGAVDNLADNVARLAKRARELGDRRLDPDDRTRFFALVEHLAPRVAVARVEAPALVRRQAKELVQSLAKLGLTDVDSACRTLVEIGASEAAYQLAQLAERTQPKESNPLVEPLDIKQSFVVLVGYLEEYAYLSRNAHSIRTAIRRITRIVGALKGYSHLDQAKVTAVDLHEGIENTLIILHSELKYGINLTRKYSDLPAVPVFVDELNQVWTNLIHNAVQALSQEGDITIETAQVGDEAVITVEDSGPGIPADVMPRIFEPFFTTKLKGEGTGLGLGIVKQIVDKHGGHIEVTSGPGRTRFTVRLPIGGPPSTPPGATNGLA